MLLVAAIMGIVAAIAVPSFVRSIKGNRLRAASRTIVKAGRYARSMAILSQKEMAIVFNIGSSQIAVHGLATVGDASSGTDDDSDRPHDAAGVGRGPASPAFDPATNSVDAASSGLGPVTLTRKLDRVLMDYIAIGGDKDSEPLIEGAAIVKYLSNTIHAGSADTDKMNSFHLSENIITHQEFPSTTCSPKKRVITRSAIWCAA